MHCCRVLQSQKTRAYGEYATYQECCRPAQELKIGDDPGEEHRDGPHRGGDEPSSHAVLREPDIDSFRVIQRGWQQGPDPGRRCKAKLRDWRSQNPEQPKLHRREKGLKADGEKEEKREVAGGEKHQAKQ